jgi:hypothetical protein
VGLSGAEQTELRPEPAWLHPAHDGRQLEPGGAGKVPDETELDPESGDKLGLHVETSNAHVHHDACKGDTPFHLTSDGNLDRDSLMAPFFVHRAILLPPVSRWHRHLEGWQLAVVVVGSALAAAALAVPRAVEPREIPLPPVDRSEEARTVEIRQALVDGAHKTPLPFQVRAVGEALRRFGEAEARSDFSKGEELSREVSAGAAEARKQWGDAPLLALRAVQVDLFVRAVLRWTTTGTLDRDITELGGGFVRHAGRNGWVTNRRLLVDLDGVAVIFFMRWTKLVGLVEQYPFSPSLNEWRLYYRTLILHPESSLAEPEAEAELLAGYVGALAKRDPDYPELLARGILDYRRGHYAAAAEALAEHLRTHRGGPWWLRARNYLVAAHEQIPPED